MALGIGIGISFCLRDNTNNSVPIVASASGDGTPTITFTLTTENTYAGVEWGENPTYSWSAFDAAASTSHTIILDATDGLVAGTLYIWRPYTNTDPLDGVGTRVYGTGGTVYAATVPGAPTGLTLGTATATTQPISWTAPASNGGSALTDYVVQYKENSSGTWLTFTDGVGTGVSTTVTGLTASTSYDYRVAAVNVVGTSGYTATSTGSTATASGVAAPTLTGSPTLLASWDFDRSDLIMLSGGDIDSISGADGTSYTLLTPGNMPSQEARGGKNTARFTSASSEYMQIASNLGINPANGCTFVLVLELADAIANQNVFEVADGTVATNRQRYNHQFVTGATGLRTRKAAAAASGDAQQGSAFSAAKYLAVCRFPGGTATCTHHIDGEGAGDSSGSVAAPTSLVTTTLGAILASSALSNYLNGWVWRVLVYSGDIGATAAEEVAVWANTNYGTTNTA